MRQQVVPKFLRVKDEPEVATARTFGGVGTVLYSGAVANQYLTGDSGFQVQSITFNDLDADYLVRFEYEIHGYLSTTAFLRFAMDLDGDTPVEGTSYYSSVEAQFYGWDSGTETQTIFLAGTAVVPSGTHTITPYWDDVTLGDQGYASGTQDPVNVNERWSIDIIDKASNDAFDVEYGGGFANANLGESFTWVPFQQGNA